MGSTLSSPEKIAAKQEKKAAKLEVYAGQCRDEEQLRWGPVDPEAELEQGQSVRAIVHRYQRVVGVSLPLSPVMSRV